MAQMCPEAFFCDARMEWRVPDERGPRVKHLAVISFDSVEWEHWCQGTMTVEYVDTGRREVQEPLF